MALPDAARIIRRVVNGVPQPVVPRRDGRLPVAQASRLCVSSDPIEGPANRRNMMTRTGGTPVPPWPVCCLLIALFLLSAPARAQAPSPDQSARTIPITGDRLSGFVLPIEPVEADIEFAARRAFTWTVDDTKRLLLEGDVLVRIGRYDFEADQAVIWLNRLPSEGGLINQIAIYFDRVTNPVSRAGLGVAGADLLVTGSARGEVNLSAWSVDPQRPRGSVFLQQAEQRLASHLRRLAATEPDLAIRPQVEYPEPEVVDRFIPEPGGAITAQDIELPEVVEVPEFEDMRPWLRDPAGSVNYIAEHFTYTPGAEEDIITLTGSFVLEYIASPRGQDFSQITLTAQRAVIFADPGLTQAVGSGRIGAESIRGIYLEGDVLASADDGDYTARAPRMYYDFRTGQAVMVDAILRTYLRQSTLPVYARAAELRQIASNQWSARNVVVSTSEFFTPHFAIGAERMTITRRPTFADPTEKETYLESENNTLRAGGVPFFWWPGFKGTLRDVPLRSVTVGSRTNDGVRIETSSDLLALLGAAPVEGLELRLGLDYFSKRGVGVGLTADYDRPEASGALDLYGVDDDGEDRTTSGIELDQDAFRGAALWEHTASLPLNWDFQVQASSISDEAFIDAWRPDDFRERREYETSVYLRNQSGHSAFTLLSQYELNDFISNDYLLASRGYQVDKLPEVAFRSYGNPWFDGAVTYSNEFRVSRMRFVFEKHSENDLGIRDGAFPGIGPDTPVEDLLRMQGLSTRFITRYDTRHEWAIPLTSGALNVTPFLVARATGYDDEFEEFTSDTDKLRLFGAAGVRVSAMYQRVNNSVEDRVFDLHRLRHIVEPSITLWYGYSDVSEQDLPEYDVEVESLGAAAVIRAGVRNTWQTQRGGPGRWRSVDVLMIDTGVVFDTSDANRESPAAQFFDYRPEYSQFGDHIYGSFAWLLSDSLSISGTGTYDLEDNLLARGSIGSELRHSPLLSSHVEYRFLEFSESELLGFGFSYLLTPKYSIAVTPEWDFNEDDFRAVTGRLRRAFPDFTFTTVVRYDQIQDETTVAASIDLAEF